MVARGGSTVVVTAAAVMPATLALPDPRIKKNNVHSDCDENVGSDCDHSAGSDCTALAQTVMNVWDQTVTTVWAQTVQHELRLRRMRGLRL